MIKESQPDDNELIKRTLSNDKSAYNLLVKKHQQALRAFIASRCKYASDVDDLAQEAFIIAYHKLVALEKTDNFRSWLCGIGLNLVRNHHRKFNPAANGTDDELTELITHQLETEITLDEQQYSFSLLQSCTHDLPSQSNTLIKLHYIDELSIKALSTQLNLKHSTLTMRLHRIRALLKKCIEEKLARDNS